MPRGLDRSDINQNQPSYRSGTPVVLPKNFGTVINHAASEIAQPGNVIPTDSSNTNVVNWTPNPAHFGNKIS